MDVREKLVELLDRFVYDDWYDNGEIAEKLIANGVTVQEWISVGSPPKKPGDYLCYFKYEPESPNVICQNTYYGSGRWMSESDRVAYWMPLPPLPKGENHNE